MTNVTHCMKYIEEKKERKKNTKCCMWQAVYICERMKMIDHKMLHHKKIEVCM